MAERAARSVVVKPLDKEDLGVGTVAALLGLLLSLTVLARLVPVAPDAGAAVVAVVLATALVASFWFFPLVRWAWATATAIPKRKALLLLAASLAIGALVAGFVPFRPSPLEPVEVLIEPTGEKSPDAVSNEVWVRIRVDGRLVAPEAVPHPGWLDRDDYIVWVRPSPDEPGPPPVRWKRLIAHSLRLEFVRHTWSGKVRVTSGGRTEHIDLYAAEASGPLEVEFSPTTDSGGLPELRFGNAALTTLLVAVALFCLLLRLTRPPAPRPQRERSLGFDAWFYAVPLVWLGLWLLALFAPGLMTSDSVDQWRQASTGAYNDAHPIAHTLLMGGLQRLWSSPALFALVQLLALGLATGSFIAVVSRALGAPRWAAMLGAGAVHPMVAVTSVTLWKDGLYTAAVVALAAWVAARVLLSPGQRPSRAQSFAIGGVVFFAMMLRHNGPPAALAALALVAWLSPRARPSVATVAAVAASLVLLLKGPVMTLLKVTPSSLIWYLYVHRIGAHLAVGQLPEAEKDRALLREIDPTPNWRYTCSSIDPTIFTSPFDARKARDNTAELRAIWRNLALEHPKEEVRHALCASSLVWRFDDTEYLNRTAIGLRDDTVWWIYRMPGAPDETPVFPIAVQCIGKKLQASNAWWLWRPAVWLYVFIAGVVVAARRRRDARVLSLLALPLVHSAALAAVNVAQDARYQLPIYVFALACTPVLLTARRREAAPT